MTEALAQQVERLPEQLGRGEIASEDEDFVGLDVQRAREAAASVGVELEVEVGEDAELHRALVAMFDCWVNGNLLSLAVALRQRVAPAPPPEPICQLRAIDAA